MPTPRLAVLLSGTGRSLQNLIDRINAGQLDAELVCVISDQPDAYGLVRARLANRPTFVFSRQDYDSTLARSEAIFERCREFGVDLVCLAGFLQLLSIPHDFHSRVMNIHPSLLPAFGGKGMFGERVHRAVLDAGVKLTGCTVHFADNTYDTGPIIVQRAVPVLDDDTSTTLAARVLVEEFEAFPEAITLFGQDRLRVEGRRVRVLSG